MRKLYTRQNIIFGFLLAVVVILSFVFYVFRNINRSIGETERINNALLSLQRLENIMDDVQDVESGQRSYVISQNPRFLEPYQKGMDRLVEDTAAIKELFSLYPNRVNRYKELLSLILEKTSLASNWVEMVNKGDHTAALQAVQAGRGKDIMDSIRSIVYLFEQEERVVLREANAKRKAVGLSTTRQLFALVSLLFAGLLWLVWRLLREEKQRKKDEQQIAYLAAITEQASDAIFSTDMNGVIQSWNRGAENLYGFSRKEVTGRFVSDITRSGLTPEKITHLLSSFSGKEGVNLEVLSYHKNGQTIHGLASVTPLRNNKTEITGYVVVLRDISERKKAEQLLEQFNAELNREVLQQTSAIKESEEKYRTLVQQAADGIFITSTDGNYLEVNDHGCAMLGFTREEILRMHMNDIVVWEGDAVPSRVSELKAGHSVIQVRRLRKKDGTLMESEIHAKQLSDGRLLGIVRDVSERKRAEKQLAASEQNLRYALSSSSDNFYVVDKNLTVTLINKAASANLEKAWGQPVVAGTNIRALLPAEENEPVRASFEKVFRGEKVEYELSLSVEGLPSWVQVNYMPVHDDHNHIVGAYVASKDISHRKEAQEQLIREKEFSESIISSLPGVLYLYDDQFNFLRWNDNFEQVTGYTGAEISRMSPIDFFDQDEKELLGKRIESVFENGFAEVEAHFLTKGGAKIPYYFNGRKVLFEGKICLVGVGIDISQRKKAEEEILEANERFNLIAKATNDFVWDAYLAEEKVWWNDNYYLQLGWKKGVEIPGGESWEDHIHPGDKARVTKKITQVLEETTDTVWTDEYRFGKADGSFITVYDRGYIIRNEKGKATRMIGAMTDISAIKEAEKELRESEEKYRLLFKNNPMPMWVLDTDQYRFMAVNNAALHHYGYNEKEFLSLTALDIRPEAERTRFLNGAQSARKTLYHAGIWRHQKKNGEQIDVEIYAYPVMYEGRRAELILVNDVTEKLKSEELLKKSYEDIRRLASHLEQIREEERIHIAREIHDELGQQLTVLKMDISWLAKKIDNTDEKVKERFRELVEMADHTVRSVRRISSELRPGMLDDLGLPAAMEWHAQEFEKRSGIRVNLRIESGDIKLPGTIATTLFRVFQESLTNVGRHAEATLVQVLLQQKNHRVILQIKDNGKGFDKRGIENKKTLGILGIQERVAIIQGSCQIESAPGKGTTITAEVPAGIET